MKYKINSFLNELWYSKLRYCAAYIIYFVSYLAFNLRLYKRSRNLCARSIRYGLIPHAVFLYKKSLERMPYSKGDVSNGVSLSEAALRSIIVKWPQYDNEKIEKGIIIVTFTKTFSFYAKNINLDEFQKHFWLILEPSWSGYADPDIFYFYKKHSGIMVSCSEQEDRILLNCFKETFIPVSFGASDWVDYRKFSPVNVEKIYDSIYVANTRPIKRVKRYLDAISNIVKRGNSEYKALLVCASWGGGEQLVKELVRCYSLENNIELKFSLGVAELIEYICRSRVNVLLSYKEGSNRSLFESMFCNVPVICISENVGVNKSYINESTGVLIPDLFLEDALLSLKGKSQNYQPRVWAMNNISPEVTTEKMLEGLSFEDIGRERLATLIKTNNPEVSYFDYPRVSHRDYTESILRIFDVSKLDETIAYKKEISEMQIRFNKMLTG